MIRQGSQLPSLADAVTVSILPLQAGEISVVGIGHAVKTPSPWPPVASRKTAIGAHLKN